MSIVIGLIGYSKSGKDETAKTLLANDFKRYAFGDAVKNEYADLNKLPREEMFNECKELHRPGIIAYGEGKRKINPNHWIEVIEDDILNDMDCDEDIVITDIRRIPEIDYIQKLKKNKKYFDTILLIHIERPKENGGVFDEDAESSKAIMYANFHGYFDYKIVNNSTPQALNNKINNILTLLNI